VEVWDIVDKSQKRKQVEGLKMNSLNGKMITELLADQPALDAEFIDVYKNTNGVILVFDMTKAWTFEYVQRELPNIPANIPVIVLANHRDMGHHRAVTEDQVQAFIESMGRSGSGHVRYAESSMRNGFGLKYLYKFFNLPFLHLQRETLLKQIEVNNHEIDATCQELGILQQSDEQNYDRFLYTIQNRRREIADKLSNVPAPAPSATSNGTTSTNPPPRSMSMPLGLMNGTQTAGTTEIIKHTPSIIIGANNPLPSHMHKSHTSAKLSGEQSTSWGGGGNKFINKEDHDQLKMFLEDIQEGNPSANKTAEESDRLL
jgi:GTPase SAR1 family protein